MILSFFRNYFENFQVGDASRSRIHQRERPHKNSEDNYDDHGFWDPNSQNISQQKIFWRIVGII